VTHFGFFCAGIVTVLESFSKVPYDTWRVAIALGFVNQAVIFYGHKRVCRCFSNAGGQLTTKCERRLEQKDPESTLHMLMAWFGLATGLAFLSSTLASSPTVAVTLHVAAAGGIALHGLWLLWIAQVRSPRARARRSHARTF